LPHGALEMRRRKPPQSPFPSEPGVRSQRSLVIELGICRSAFRSRHGERCWDSRRRSCERSLRRGRPRSRDGAGRWADARRTHRESLHPARRSAADRYYEPLRRWSTRTSAASFTGYRARIMVGTGGLQRLSTKPASSQYLYGATCRASASTDPRPAMPSQVCPGESARDPARCARPSHSRHGRWSNACRRRTMRRLFPVCRSRRAHAAEPRAGAPRSQRPPARPLLSRPRPPKERSARDAPTEHRGGSSRYRGPNENFVLVA